MPMTTEQIYDMELMVLILREAVEDDYDRLRSIIFGFRYCARADEIRYQIEYAMLAEHTRNGTKLHNQILAELNRLRTIQ